MEQNYQNNQMGNYQQNNSQGSYNPPPQGYAPQQPMGVDMAPTMTVVDWLLTIFLSGIPIVGFILLLVWSFDSSTNPSKKNYCRAILIFVVIGTVFGLLFGLTMLQAIVGMIRGMGGMVR